MIKTVAYSNDQEQTIELIDKIDLKPQHTRASDILYSFFEDQYCLNGSQQDRFKKYEKLSEQIGQLYKNWYDISTIYKKLSITDRKLVFSIKLLLFESGSMDVYVQITPEAEWQLIQLATLFNTSINNLLRMAIFCTLDFDIIKGPDIEYINNMLFRYKRITKQLDYLKIASESYFQTIENDFVFGYDK